MTAKAPIPPWTGALLLLLIATTFASNHVAARLARYKVPVRVFEIDAFPVTEGTNATKIQKHRLRDLAQERLDAGPA